MRNRTKEDKKQALLAFCEEHKIFDDIGTLCMIGCGNPTIAKLVAISEDSGDYYYVLLYHDKGLIFDTCVNRCQSLKGKIEEYDYHVRAFDNCLKLNPHLLKEGAKIDLLELKKNAAAGDDPTLKTGIYSSKNEIIHGYTEVS